MTSAYSYLVQNMWLSTLDRSPIQDLMQAHRPSDLSSQSQSRSTDDSRQISRISYLEEQHEKSLLNTRNFGYHWLKPIGLSKTMSQVEDETREVHESYEEFEDEEGEFNQNNPELNGGMEGQEAFPVEEDDQTEESEDLDEVIEEGASFEVEDPSFVSGAPMTPPYTMTGLHDVANESVASLSSQDCLRELTF